MPITYEDLRVTYLAKRPITSIQIITPIYGNYEYENVALEAVFDRDLGGGYGLATYARITSSSRSAPKRRKQNTIDHTIDPSSRMDVPNSFVSGHQAVRHINQIEDLYIHQHRDVMEDPRWQRIYHGAQRDLNFLRSPPGGGALTSSLQNLWSYPCHYCGIVLPAELIQVDHRQPQKYKNIAILKVLHSLEAVYPYTTEPGHGTRGSQIDNILKAKGVAATDAAIALLNQAPISGSSFTKRPWVSERNAMLARPGKANRYALSNAGKTFFNLYLVLRNLTSIQNACCNSLLNLVPACAQCNGAAGKGEKTHAH